MLALANRHNMSRGREGGNSAGNISLEWVQRIKLFDVLHCPFGRIDDDDDGTGISRVCVLVFILLEHVL